MSTMLHESGRPAEPGDHAVRLAESAGERDRVFRFRYESFAAEYGRWPAPGLVARKMIRDEADERASLLFVEVGGRVAGTLRLRLGRLPDELRGPFGLPAAEASLALADEIVVSRIFRKASTLESMLEAAAVRSGDAGARRLFCHARADAVPVYRSSGFQEAAVPFVHPDYGSRVPLVRFIGPEARSF